MLVSWTTIWPSYERRLNLHSVKMAFWMIMKFFWKALKKKTNKPEHFHKIQRLCSKNQRMLLWQKVLTVFLIFTVILFQVFHLTEKLTSKWLLSADVIYNLIKIISRSQLLTKHIILMIIVTFIYNIKGFKQTQCG